MKSASVSFSLILGLAGCGGGGGHEGPDGGGGSDGGGGGGGDGDGTTSCDQRIAEFEQDFEERLPAVVGASDGTHLYVYNDDGFHRVPIAGGERELVAMSPAPWGMTMDDTHIYWSGYTDGSVLDSQIARVPKTGGAVEILLTATEEFLEIVAVRDGSVIFVHENASYEARLRVRDAAGNLTDLGDMTDVYAGTAVHGDHAYFGREESEESGVASVALTGGTPEWLAHDPSEPYYLDGMLSGMTDYAAGPGGLFVTGQNIVCSEYGTVARVDWGTGEIQLLATEQECPTEVRVDAMHVVWQLANFFDDPGAIAAAPIGGGDPHVVATSDETTDVTLMDLADGVVFYASGSDVCRTDL